MFGPRFNGDKMEKVNGRESRGVLSRRDKSEVIVWVKRSYENSKVIFCREKQTRVSRRGRERAKAARNESFSQDGEMMKKFPLLWSGARARAYVCEIPLRVYVWMLRNSRKSSRDLDSFWKLIVANFIEVLSHFTRSLLTGLSFSLLFGLFFSFAKSDFQPGEVARHFKDNLPREQTCAVLLYARRLVIEIKCFCHFYAQRAHTSRERFGVARSRWNSIDKSPGKISEYHEI